MQQLHAVCVRVCVAGTCAPVVIMTCDIASLATHYRMVALLGAVWSSAFIFGFDVCATACLT